MVDLVKAKREQSRPGGPMTKELTWSQAIEQVLRSSPIPLHYNEITERIIADGLRKSLSATPAATVNAQITASIKSKGTGSPYIRTAKGTFTLEAILVEALEPRQNRKRGDDLAAVEYVQ
jgi:hypothetical protein